jgi:hypothetical protein
MISNTRTRAETSFAAIRKHQKPVLSEQDEVARIVREKSTRLKALRLVREATNLAEGPQKKLGAKKRDRKRLPS